MSSAVDRNAFARSELAELNVRRVDRHDVLNRNVLVQTRMMINPVVIRRQRNPILARRDAAVRGDVVGEVEGYGLTGGVDFIVELVSFNAEVYLDRLA